MRERLESDVFERLVKTGGEERRGVALHELAKLVAASVLDVCYGVLEVDAEEHEAGVERVRLCLEQAQGGSLQVEQERVLRPRFGQRGELPVRWRKSRGGQALRLEMERRRGGEDIVRGPRAVEAQGALTDGVDAKVAQGGAGRVCRRSPERAVRPLAAKACEIGRPDGESSMVFHDGSLRCAAFSQNSPSVFVRKIQPKMVKQESAEVKTTVLPASAASLPICCAIA